MCAAVFFSYLQWQFSEREADNLQFTVFQRLFQRPSIRLLLDSLKNRKLPAIVTHKLLGPSARSNKKARPKSGLTHSPWRSAGGLRGVFQTRSSISITPRKRQSVQRHAGYLQQSLLQQSYLSACTRVPSPTPPLRSAPHCASLHRFPKVRHRIGFHSRSQHP